VSGLFVAPVYRMTPEARVYQEILDSKIPTVVLGHTAPFCQQFVNVETDDLLASYALTQHLIKLGHKRIAFFAGPAATPWTQERFEGYRRALREYGLDVDDKLVFEAGRTIEDGAKAALQMINETKGVTAVQAINDMVAVGCMKILTEQGVKVPEQVSVVGFGNILLSEHCRVPLTTVRQPKFTLGTAAVDAMVKLLAGQRPESRRLPAELIIRASTAPAPGK
jgi:LacI family transcriptional regulator